MINVTEPQGKKGGSYEKVLFVFNRINDHVCRFIR